MSLRWFMVLYTALWIAGLPLVLLYLAWRGRRDRDYLRHWPERFGVYRQRMAGSVWIHAVSLGEMRSALPLVRAFLGRGERVVITLFTPAGRREAARVLAAEIAAGQVAAVWVPFEYGWTFRRFFRAFRPRAGLVMEVEHWPRMILAARRAGVPLFACNAQYPLRSFDKDRLQRPWRLALIGHYAGALVKSGVQAERFRATGLRDVVVTGETRFDQPVPDRLLRAGAVARAWLAASRRVVTIASAVEGEDDIYVQAINELQDHLRTSDEDALILYVPRRPERFAEVGARLRGAGFRVGGRSDLFDAALSPQGAAPQIDVLLGDSLGEMYFYLAMCDRVVVGGGFTPAGAHNIIEPLVLGKPVLTGPVTWPIEFPFAEAVAAGLARSVPDAASLAAALARPAPHDPAAMAAFIQAHSGAAARTLAALDRLTSR
ncbi:MAG: 3-deoxy-D-manno-octulosonic acid transferase [Gemmobacter sp.]